MMDRKMVNFIKEQYPPGTRIRLNSMDDPYAPILPGTEGEVDFVDDEGQIFMKWDNGRTLPLAPGEDSFTVLPPKLTTLKLYMPLTADLYERNEYGDLDDSSTLLEGAELRGYQNQITAALVKNRMPEETERGLMHWYHKPDSINTKVHSAVFTVDSRGGELWGVAECRVAGQPLGQDLARRREFVPDEAQPEEPSPHRVLRVFVLLGLGAGGFDLLRHLAEQERKLYEAFQNPGVQPVPLSVCRRIKLEKPQLDCAVRKQSVVIEHPVP